MRQACWLPLLVLLLAGCAGHQPRPSGAPAAGTPGQPRGNAVPASPGDGTGIHDDLRRDQSSRYRDGKDSVPSGPPPDVSKLAEPVPRVEPRSTYGNRSPYTVLGRTYRVLPSAHGYVARGVASFYGNKFNGYKTSNLENYDMYKFSAAHKTLPLPSYARVTNLANGKSVIVRINDRGPFHAHRLIDLSYAAAVKIGVWPRGTAMVEVRAIDPTSAITPDARVSNGEPTPSDGVPDRVAAHGTFLQVGAYADATNAERVATQLRAAHLGPVQLIEAQLGGRTIHRVRVGPLATAQQLNEAAARIDRMGLPHPTVAVD